MKKYGLLCLILPLLLLLIPLIRLQPQSEAQPALSSAVLDNPVSVEKGVSDTFRLYRTQSGTVENLSAADYICGVVAAEMPALYEPEALKAQAVAAYTFACRRKGNAKQESYDLTDDSTVDQAYLSEAECREKWGENADEWLKKIRSAVESVSGVVLLYNGDLALAVYHAVSSGRTESAVDIWGGEVPYLVSVSSESDRTAENYKNTVTLSGTEFAEKLSGAVTLTGNPEMWVEKSERTASGTVKTLVVGGKQLTGAQMRERLALKSANFEISCKDGVFTVTSYGYGHGVGMSQHGANEMAKQGSGYAEILGWYYPGCTVEKVQK